MARLDQHTEKTMIHRQSSSRRVPPRWRWPVAGVASFVVSGALLALLPAAALAVDAPAVPQRSAPVVFVVIILLLGSVTAGILFASPLRGRLGRGKPSEPTTGAASGLSARIGDGLPRMPGGDIYGNEYDAPATTQPAHGVPSTQPLPSPYAPSASQPVQSQPNALKPGVSSPWSTGDTRPDPNMDRKPAS